MVLAFLMVYFGVQSYRDNVAGGSVTFGRALKVGLLISLVIMACYVVIWEVMYYNFMPDFLDKYTAYALEQARQSGASADAIAAQAKEMQEFGEMYKNPLVNIAFTLLEPLPVAVVFTLVTAGDREPQADDARRGRGRALTERHRASMRSLMRDPAAVTRRQFLSVGAVAVAGVELGRRPRGNVR